MAASAVAVEVDSVEAEVADLEAAEAAASVEAVVVIEEAAEEEAVDLVAAEELQEVHQDSQVRDKCCEHEDEAMQSS